MATFELQAPDGEIYEVEAPDQGQAVAAFKKMIGRQLGPTKDAAIDLERKQAQDQANYLRSYPNDFANPVLQDVNETPKAGYLRSPPQGIANTIARMGQSYVDKALLGGGDELGAAVSTAAKNLTGNLGGQTPNEAFQAKLAELQNQRQQFEAGNPGIATAANVAGVVGSPANLIGGEYIAAGPTAPWRIARASGVGTGIGGVAGGLSTEGGLTDRAAGGATGAALGFATGAVAQPAMELLGFGARKGTETGAAVLNTIRNQMQARANPGVQADRLLARAFMEDQRPLGFGPAPADVTLPGQGLVNMGGENINALARQTTVGPGPARTTAANFFEEQAAGAPDRAAESIKTMADRGYYGTAKELDEARKATALPLKEAAYAKPAVQSWTPRIAELFKRPSMKAALAKAKRIAEEEGRDPKELGLDFNEAGDPMFLAGADKNGQIPSTQTMDYVKRGLDDVVETYRDKTTGKLVLDTEGNAINNTRAEFVGILKEQNPEYAAYLKAWAGPSHALDILQEGRTIYNSRGAPADAIRRFQSLSPEDQDLARIGFVRNAIEDLGNVGDSGSVYLKLFGSQNKRAVAEVMFPDEASFNRFATQMQAEKKMLGTNQMVMGGSPTARIGAENAAFDQATNALSFLDALKSSNPLKIAGVALDKARNLQRGVTPEVADALANRLYTTNPTDIQRVLSQIGATPPTPVTQFQPAWLRRNAAVQFGGQGAGMFGGQLFSQPSPMVPQ
jgi:hypothetical protein